MRWCNQVIKSTSSAMLRASCWEVWTCVLINPVFKGKFTSQTPILISTEIWRNSSKERDTREQDLRMKVDNVIGRGRKLAEKFGRVADGLDFVAGDYDSAVPEDTGFRIHGDDHGVVKYCERVGIALRLHSFPQSAFCKASFSPQRWNSLSSPLCSIFIDV